MAVEELLGRQWGVEQPAQHRIHVAQSLFALDGEEPVPGGRFEGHGGQHRAQSEIYEFIILSKARQVQRDASKVEASQRANGLASPLSLDALAGPWAPCASATPPSSRKTMPVRSCKAT